MTTLESRYDERVKELSQQRAAPGVVSDAEVEYMLDAMPFVREYSTTTQPSPRDTAAVAPKMRGGTTGIDSFVTVKHKSNKNLIFQRYLVEVEKSTDAAQAMPTDRMRVNEDAMTCPHCDKSFVFNPRESELVCVSCGIARTHSEMSEHNLTYDQEVQQTSIVNYFAYKRLNHFTEWLNSLQAKENTDIPPEVLEAVRSEFRKERASKRGDIKPSKVRAYLKKLRLNKYYENTNQICNAVNGMPAPKLPQSLEDRLKRMFIEIQEPFNRWCPPTRKNFLSYSYVLFKFCELLGEDEYLEVSRVGGRLPKRNLALASMTRRFNVCRAVLPAPEIIRKIVPTRLYLEEHLQGPGLGICEVDLALLPRAPWALLRRTQPVERARTALQRHGPPEVVGRDPQQLLVEIAPLGGVLSVGQGGMRDFVDQHAADDFVRQRLTIGSAHGDVHDALGPVELAPPHRLSLVIDHVGVVELLDFAEHRPRVGEPLILRIPGHGRLQQRIRERFEGVRCCGRFECVRYRIRWAPMHPYQPCGKHRNEREEHAIREEIVQIASRT